MVNCNPNCNPRLWSLKLGVRGSPRWCREDPAACRVGSEGLKQRGRQPIRRGVRGGSPALQLGALLIRRSGHIAQDRPSLAARWADIPGLSARDRRCPAAWQQYWQQSRRDGTDPRPSAFQAGHIPKSPDNVRASGAVVGRRCLPLVVAVAVTVAVSSAQVVRGQADPDPQGLSVPEDRKRGRPFNRSAPPDTARDGTASAGQMLPPGTPGCRPRH